MEDSFSASFAATEAASAAAASSEEHTNVGDDDDDDHHSKPNSASPKNDIDEFHISAIEAMISFLFTEADLAEDRAKRLRGQAKNLAEQFGLDFKHHNRSRLASATTTDDDNDMAPLDEHGNPRYKGRKRGRKPKPRIRKHKVDREKRKLTGYTLFVQETHPLIKSDNRSATSAQIVSIVAKQWRDLPESQRRRWKERALATHDDEDQVVNHDAQNGIDDDQNDDSPEDFTGVELMAGGDGDEDDSPVPPARKRTRRQQ